MNKDYYKTLGLSKSATPDDIKRAYKKLAVKYHPDVNKEKGAEEKFKEINEAYQVLSNPQKKSNYEQFGTADFGQGFSGFSNQGFDFNFSNFSAGNFEGFDDIFDVFFGGGGRRKNKKGSDIEIILPLSFEEAVFGKDVEISYSVLDKCSQCYGQGGTNLKTCPVCNGSGKITKTTRTILGSFAQTAICSSCKGRGEIPENICRKCAGSGVARQTKNIKVKIPAGVDNNSSVRVAYGGEAGEDGNGDLYLRIKVNPHKEFIRQDTNIYSEKEISFSQAVLGDKIEINTIYGPVKLTIPAGTSSHTEFRLKEKGVPHPNRNIKGNHLVLIKIKVPKKLSREEREILEKLRNMIE